MQEQPPASSMSLEFARALPKVELHAHLTGSISRECLHGIWQQKKAVEPDLALEDPLVAMPPGKVDYDVKTFFPLFSNYIYNLCNDFSSIEESTAAVLRDFQADNVVYLELRTTPRAHPENYVTKAKYVDTILKVISAHNQNRSNTMRAFLILSVDRTGTFEDALHTVELAIGAQKRGVVGIDLCGNFARGNVAIFEPAFRRAKEAGLRITLHFAESELSATDEELSTLLSWEPERLGHVIHVTNEMQQEIVRRKIGVELCLTCNVQAKMIRGGFADHHFGWWKDQEVGVALSTDDVGIFCSPLSEEYCLAAKHFNMSIEDVKKLCSSTVELIFSNEREKSRLRKIYTEWEGWNSVDT